MTRQKRSTAILFYVLVLLVCAVILAPVFMLVSYSLRTSQELFSLNLTLLPRTPTLAAYTNALFAFEVGGSGFLRWTLNSILLCSVATVVAGFCAALGGYALTRFRFMGRKLLWFLIIMTQTVPWVVLLIPYYAQLSSWNLLDNLTSLGITYLAIFTPVATWLFTGFFQNMTPEIEEAARLDGCTQWGVFYRIVLPLSAPALAAVALFTFVIGWGDFLFASVLIKSADIWTLPLGLTSFQGEREVRWAEIMAMSTLVTIPVVLLFLYLQRYLVNLMAGSLK